MDIRSVPIIWVFFKDQRVIRSNVFDLKRSAGDYVFLSEPFFSPRLDRFLRNKPEKLVCQQPEKKRCRLAQCNTQGVVVCSLNAYVVRLYRHKFSSVYGSF